MLMFPNAKINIGLYITDRRTDGYHDLETIFYPIPQLHDAIEAVPAITSDLHFSGNVIAGNTESNLVWKAYQMFRELFPQQVGELDIYLLKKIPTGAGLGGGSADGAFMLRLVNNLCSLKLEDEYLAELALQLGSDCPFFIYNSPQYATGRGEKMQPVQINLSDFSMQLICPHVHISTAKAFEMITPKIAGFDLQKLEGLPVIDWKKNVHNDFETPVFKQYPQLSDIKKQLYNQGAAYASMSGSGSTIYGLFPKFQRAIIQSDIRFEEFYFE
jgi:4-diphosphocytidyl-2-C-methyl-D-erythritol kinase